MGPLGETTRNGVHTGVGYGSMYASRTVNGVLMVSTLGLDGAWWAWTGTAWARIT
jgi:hypothetical protein